jgi:hypothetical protein
VFCFKQQPQPCLRPEQYRESHLYSLPFSSHCAFELQVPPFLAQTRDCLHGAVMLLTTMLASVDTDTVFGMQHTHDVPLHHPGTTRFDSREQDDRDMHFPPLFEHLLLCQHGFSTGALVGERVCFVGERVCCVGEAVDSVPMQQMQSGDPLHNGLAIKFPSGCACLHRCIVVQNPFLCLHS